MLSGSSAVLIEKPRHGAQTPIVLIISHSWVQIGGPTEATPTIVP